MISIVVVSEVEIRHFVIILSIKVNCTDFFFKNSENPLILENKLETVIACI